MTGCTSGGYDQLETSPETIEQELRPAVCEHRQTDRLMENYSIDSIQLLDMAILTVPYQILCPNSAGGGGHML